jgi:hypothetical protein
MREVGITRGKTVAAERAREEMYDRNGAHEEMSA